MHEFLQEFRDNWDNEYWWADHPALRAFLIGTMLGALGLAYNRIKPERVQRVHIMERDK